MKLNYKLLLYLPILFLFFPAFYFPLCGKFYMVFYIFLDLTVLFFIFNDYKGFINKIYSIIKYTPLKLFVFLLIFMALNSLFLSVIGVTTLSRTISAIVVQFVLGIIPILLYFIYILDKYISYDNFMKLFIFLYWIFLIVGFVAYIGQFFNIEIINNIFDIFANVRFFEYESSGVSNLRNASNYEAFGLPRLDNLCVEPSSYAQFLYLFLPFTYSFANSKLFIVSNKLLSKIIKITLIPLTWISIVLTFSPIYLIFSIIITAIYYHREIIQLIKKYSIIIFFIICFLFIIIAHIDFSDTYISRIINVITQIKSFEDFIIVEPSLATRFCSYINSFCIFLKNPITGVGLGNLVNEIYLQYLHSPIPLTEEIFVTSQMKFNTIGVAHVNLGLLYLHLSENGFLAGILLLNYYFKLLKKIKILESLALQNLKKSKILIYSKALLYSLIGIGIISFYNIVFTVHYLHLISALSIALIYREIIIKNDEIDINRLIRDEKK